MTMENNGWDMATFLNTAMNRDDGMFGNNSLLWLFIMILFFGVGGNGLWGNRTNTTATDVAVGEAVQKAVAEARADGLSDQVIIDAVKGNGAAINQLATTLNCDINSIKNTLCALDKSISQIGNQLGMSTQQIINAVQAGNCEITRAIENCCCTTKQLITELSYGNRIQNMEQTNQLTTLINAGVNQIGNRIDAQTLAMNAGFQGIKDYLTGEKISALQLENSQLRQTNVIQAVVDAATTPIQTRVQEILARVPSAPVPAYPAPQYANGYAFGVIPTNNCCNNNCFNSCC